MFNRLEPYPTTPVPSVTRCGTYIYSHNSTHTHAPPSVSQTVIASWNWFNCADSLLTTWTKALKLSPLLIGIYYNRSSISPEFHQSGLHSAPFLPFNWMSPILSSPLSTSWWHTPQDLADIWYSGEPPPKRTYVNGIPVRRSSRRLSTKSPLMSLRGTGSGF